MRPIVWRRSHLKLRPPTPGTPEDTTGVQTRDREKQPRLLGHPRQAKEAPRLPILSPPRFFLPDFSDLQVELHTQIIILFSSLGHLGRYEPCDPESDPGLPQELAPRRHVRLAGSVPLRLPLLRNDPPIASFVHAVLAQATPCFLLVAPQHLRPRKARLSTLGDHHK